MTSATLSSATQPETSIRTNYLQYAFIFFAGLLGPLGFAPFHIPGLTILSLAFLFAGISRTSLKEAVYLGFLFGVGFFGLGVSWVIISIHDYGHLNYFIAGTFTILFIMFLALYPALMAYCFKLLKLEPFSMLAMLSFSALWCLSEFMRAYLFTGFPWILVGTSLIDTPVKYLAPIIGIYGLSFICTFVACLLVGFFQQQAIKRYYYLFAFVLLIMCPSLLKNIQWTTLSKQPTSIGAVQANLSMRDKWDQQVFWKLLKTYEDSITKLLGKQLIILPESAIPLPASYLADFLSKLDKKALAAKSALIVGILQPVNDNRDTNYYNTILSMGYAKGEHIKYQLVPFGEYIPKPFVAINNWLGLPQPNLVSGKYVQPLLEIAGHPIANLICYEIAYPRLLRQQMPKAEWIVSISDNGWFGHSLASFQQLQMAQMLSLLTGRYQVVVNNDGLSSIINAQGDIVVGLPAFSAGILQGDIFSASGSTPWVILSDYPALIFCTFFMILILILRLPRFSKQ